MMKKTIGTVALFALGLAFVLVSAPARAACGDGPGFGQQSSGCGGGFCYVTSPGLKTSTSIQASFWAVGAGNTAGGAGIDNGTFPDDQWLIDFGGSNYAIAGSWSQDTGIDGCIDTLGNGSKMAISFTDIDASNGAAFFAAACVTRDTSAGFEIDYSNIHTNIELKPIAKPVIASSVRVGNDSLVTIASPNFSSIYYSDGSPGCAIGNVIKQYDVWVQQTARDGAAPSDRNSSTGWVLGNTCNVGAQCVVNVACTGTNCDAFFAVSPRYDSGFGSTRVSVNSTRVQAGQNLANPKVKVIQKQLAPADKAPR